MRGEIKRLRYYWHFIKEQKRDRARKYRIPLRIGTTSQIPIKSRKPQKLLTRVNVRENPVLMVTSFSWRIVANILAKNATNLRRENKLNINRVFCRDFMELT